jgi:uncharacterized membrane protein
MTGISQTPVRLGPLRALRAQRRRIKVSRESGKFCYSLKPVNYIFAFALGLGFAAGLRSFTPPAVVAWAAHIGWLNLNNSPLAFMGSIITAVIFSLLALFELFLDLQPSTPKRTAPFPLVARILTGGLCGACLCAASNQSLIIGAILGAVGGVIGAFAGYEARRRLVAALNIKDVFVALPEDLVTIGLACFFVSR